jgi:acyl-CoA thioesterase FadM
MAIHAGASRIGSSSYEMELLLRQEERTVSFARATMVCLKDGKPFAMPDSFRTSVKDWMVRS